MRIRHIGVPTLKIAAGVFAVLAFTQSPSVAETASLTLQQVLEAGHNNFDVAQVRSAAVAARADILAADRSPFPTVSLKLSSIDLQNGVGEGDLLRDRRIDKGVGIDWTWERGNKRALRTQAAQFNASAAQADLEDSEMQQLLVASNAFFDLAGAQDRLALVEAIAAGTAEIAVTAARRMGSGDLARQDALRLEIESERAKSDVAVAELDRKRAELALGSVMGMRSTSLALRTQANWPKLGAASTDTTMAETAMQEWVDARPDVRAAIERVAANRTALDGAAAQKKADVTWGVSLDHFPGTSTSLLELRMQMPLQTGYQYQGETGRAQAQLVAAQDALEKVRRAAWSDVQGLKAQLRSAVLRSQSYEHDILPRAREVAVQAEFAYAKGALALNDLLDARRTLRATGLEALAALADYAKAYTAWRLRRQNGAIPFID